MGVGNFWDLLKPHARFEGFDFLRNKKVAVDLSYWIVQHETAIKGYTRNPHIRLTFFRTINLFSKFGAYPVFVLDGTPSRLKSQARIVRFFRLSGIDLSSLPEADKGVSFERNRAFNKCIEECVELLKLLGMPILKAKGEAEALCAELNRKGYVDACITADSDAFLYGAQCVVKRIQPNSIEPFECHYMSDIEAGLGLKRNHLIAISLLVGNDHDLNGITGIGLDTAVRFVKPFGEDEILNRLHEVARGEPPVIHGTTDFGGESISCSDIKSQKTKTSHCSHCGHPGNKKAHLKFSCEYCDSTAGESCWKKPVGFKCSCSSCDLDREEKAKKKDTTWKLTVCQKIASEQDFPNDEIIQMYLGNHHGIDDEPHIGWANPDTEMLVDYLAYQQHWDPSYIRQRLLPVLSTIYLRDMASCPTDNLLCGQFKFHNIQRVKIRYGHESYVVNWKKAATSFLSDAVIPIPEESVLQHEPVDLDDSLDLSEETEVPYIHIDNSGCFLSTDEDIVLVQEAFPEIACKFLKEKELKEMKSQKKKSRLWSEGKPEKTESSASRGVQLNITEFYRSSKRHSCKPEENEEKDHGSLKGKRKEPSLRLSKSTRKYGGVKRTFSDKVDGVLQCNYVDHVKEGVDMISGMDETKVISICIIVVNEDITCSSIVKEMLRSCSHQVLCTGSVFDVFHAIWEKKGGIDLVLTNADKLDSNGSEIFKYIQETLLLHVISISLDKARIESKGQSFSFSAYVLNDLSIDGVNKLWEMTLEREREKMVAAHQEKNVRRVSIPNIAAETNMASSSNQQDRGVELSESSKRDHRTSKKPRVVWTIFMHQKFLEAIEILGYENAVPTKIVEVMNIPGLTRENVASHLQKYRGSVKRTRETVFSPFNSHHLNMHPDLSFGERKNYAGIGLFCSDRSEADKMHQKLATKLHLTPNYTTYIDQKRNMLLSINKNRSSDNHHMSNVGKFIGYRLASDGKSVEYGDIKASSQSQSFSACKEVALTSSNGDFGNELVDTVGNCCSLDQSTTLQYEEPPGNDSAVQCPVAVLERISEYQLSPLPLIPRMLEFFDEGFYQSGDDGDDVMVKEAGGTSCKFDFVEFNNTIFSQDG